MSGFNPLSPGVWLMRRLRLRGKLQMRLQLNRPRHPASEVAALDVFARLCQRKRSQRYIKAGTD